MELDGLQELAAERQRREDFFEKSFDPTYIEKGKRAQIGEVRQWKDGKYKRTKEGWEPVREGKSLGSSKLDDAISVAGKALAQGRPDAMDLRKEARDMAMDLGMDPKKFQEALDTSKEAWKKDLEGNGNLVGKRFNHEGATYKVTKQGATQSEAEAVTESLKGKKITIGNKVVEKQAGGSKEDSELKKGTIVTFKTDSGIPAAGVMHSEDIIRTTTGNLLNVSYTKDLKVADDSKAEKVKSQMRSRKYADGKSYFDEYEDKE